MSEGPQVAENREKKRTRLRKSDRREQILLELKLHPHVRISELAHKFNVSAETVRRDFDKLAGDGLIARAFAQDNSFLLPSNRLFHMFGFRIHEVQQQHL